MITYIVRPELYPIRGVCNPGLSDHALIYMAWRRAKKDKDTNYVMGMNYREFNEKLYESDVRNIDWTAVYNAQTAMSAATAFREKLLKVINVHATEKITKTGHEPWVTGEYISLIPGSYSRKCPTTYNLARKREAVRLARLLQKSLQKSYIDDAIEECNGDYVKLWKVVKHFWSSKNSKTVINSMQNASSVADIPSVLNSHFCDVGSKLAKEITSNRVFIKQYNMG